MTKILIILTVLAVGSVMAMIGYFAPMMFNNPQSEKSGLYTESYCRQLRQSCTSELDIAQKELADTQTWLNACQRELKKWEGIKIK